jgi:adiponectin receptor
MRPRKATSATTTTEHQNGHIMSEAEAEPLVDTKTSGKPRLLAFEEIEDWRQDNELIRSGYRALCGTYQGCIASWAQIHNETVNIHTHLWGALAVFVLAAYIHPLLWSRYHTAAMSDRLVFAAYLMSVAFCLVMSVAFHTFMPHSFKVARYWTYWDFVGIISVVLGSSYIGVYYLLYCEPRLTAIYWLMVSSAFLLSTSVSTDACCQITAFGAGCLVAVGLPVFRTPPWRPYRAAMFLSMALSGLLPIAHAIHLYGFQQAYHQLGIEWYATEALFGVCGGILYAFRFPERLSPGTFDIWGQSHSLLHISVLLASAAHFKGALTAFDYHHNPATRMCNV